MTRSATRRSTSWRVTTCHGLTHRAVDETTAVPRGTTSNYFRTRDALLAATAEHIRSKHWAEMQRLGDQRRRR